MSSIQLLGKKPSALLETSQKSTNKSLLIALYYSNKNCPSELKTIMQWMNLVTEYSASHKSWCTHTSIGNKSDYKRAKMPPKFKICREKCPCTVKLNRWKILMHKNILNHKWLLACFVCVARFWRAISPQKHKTILFYCILLIDINNHYYNIKNDNASGFLYYETVAWIHICNLWASLNIQY